MNVYDVYTLMRMVLSTGTLWISHAGGVASFKWECEGLVIDWDHMQLSLMNRTSVIKVAESMKVSLDVELQSA